MQDTSGRSDHRRFILTQFAFTVVVVMFKSNLMRGIEIFHHHSLASYHVQCAYPNLGRLNRCNYIALITPIILWQLHSLLWKLWP